MSTVGTGTYSVVWYTFQDENYVVKNQRNSMTYTCAPKCSQPFIQNVQMQVGSNVMAKHSTLGKITFFTNLENAIQKFSDMLKP